MLSQQGEAADRPSQPQAGPGRRVQLAAGSVSTTSAGVNIDQEMANLLSLQNSYAANARVLSTVKDMLHALMNI